MKRARGDEVTVEDRRDRGVELEGAVGDLGGAGGGVDAGGRDGELGVGAGMERAVGVWRVVGVRGRRDVFCRLRSEEKRDKGRTRRTWQRVPEEAAFELDPAAAVQVRIEHELKGERDVVLVDVKLECSSQAFGDARLV